MQNSSAHDTSCDQSKQEKRSAKKNGAQTVHYVPHPSAGTTIQQKKGTHSQQKKLKEKYEKGLRLCAKPLLQLILLATDVRSQFNNVLKRSKAVGGKIEQVYRAYMGKPYAAPR